MTQTHTIFNNNPETAQATLRKVLDHQAADEIIQGHYWKEGTGCFIGCLVHDRDPILVEKLTGFPVLLTKILESIFERLPPTKAKQFLPDVIQAAAANVGADITNLPWEFLYWNAKTALDRYGNDEVRQGCADALELLKLKTAGHRISAEAVAEAVAEAADVAAYAASKAAPKAAAYAADAAYAAAFAAADVAPAARAVDRAVDAAAFAAAKVSFHCEQAAKIIELIKKANP